MKKTVLYLIKEKRYLSVAQFIAAIDEIRVLKLVLIGLMRLIRRSLTQRTSLGKLHTKCGICHILYHWL
jgi:hypothetical protein